MKSMFIPMGSTDGRAAPVQMDERGFAWAYSTEREAEIEVFDLLQSEISEAQEGLRSLSECQFDLDVVEATLTGVTHPDNPAILQVAADCLAEPVFVVTEGQRRINARSRRCFLVLIDSGKDKHCALWSSPEWEQSRQLKNTIVSVLFVTNGRDFDEASSMMKHCISQPGSRYQWASAILKE
jgi:hypothetical protein